VIDWCQNGKHYIPDAAFNSIVSAVNIFEQIFGEKFDDCDDMIAADNKLLSGIYFTGYNRKLKIGFTHSLDAFYSKDNAPLRGWCTLQGIKLITINVKPRAGYETMLADICTSVVTAGLPTQFDHMLSGDPPDGVSAEYYRATRLTACMLCASRSQ
jgi:hypothetical protein